MGKLQFKHKRISRRKYISEIIWIVFHCFLNLSNTESVGMSTRSTFRIPKSLKIAEMIYEAKSISKQSILDVRIVPKPIKRRLLLLPAYNIFVFATEHNLRFKLESVEVDFICLWWVWDSGKICKILVFYQGLLSR